MSKPPLAFRRHALSLALAAVTGMAHAATINVNSNCTLINAINNANTDTDGDGAGSGCPAGSGADAINLGRSKIYTLTAVDNINGGPNGLPMITSAITINGNGSTIRRSSNADTPEFRIFRVGDSGNLTLNKLTVTNGKTTSFDSTGSGDGGGIWNTGSLTLKQSTISGNNSVRGGGIGAYGASTLINSKVSGNSATFIGGGIFQYAGTAILSNSSVTGNNSQNSGGGIFSFGGVGGGVLQLTNSTVSGNKSVKVGGGIFNYDTSTTLLNSTISNNSATNGGGIYNSPYGGAVTLLNSTVANNSASAYGGGIENWYTLALSNSTVSGNRAGINGGGIANRFYGFVKHTTATVENSTVSGNRSLAARGGGGISVSADTVLTLINSLIANSTGGDCDGIPTFSGNNLIEDGSCGAALQGDPKLGPLLDNGGLTTTHALLTGSPALNSASNALCTQSDQRTAKRPRTSAAPCDLGAFEKIAAATEVQTIVQFFDAGVSDGTLVGTGSAALAKQKLNAMRNQLLTAGDYRHRNLQPLSCSQLARTLKRVDPDSTPDSDDYVTGTGGGGFAGEIMQLQSDWGC